MEEERSRADGAAASDTGEQTAPFCRIIPVPDLLAAVVESTDDGIFTVALDGTITSWNPGAQRLYGLTAAETIGQHVSLLAGYDNSGEAAGWLAALARGESIERRSVERRHKDGHRIYVSLTLSPIRLPDGTIVGASTIVRDMGAEHEWEQRLAAEKSFNDAVIDAAPGLFYTMDRDGRLVRWNAALAAGLSVGPHEAAGINPLDFLDPVQRATADEAIAAVMETGAGQVQVRVPMPGGDVDFIMTGRRVEIAGAPYIVGFGMDVTDRVRAEEELRSARDELEVRVEERTAALKAANLRLKRTERALLTLSWSNQTLVRATDPQKLLQDVCDAAIEVGGYRMAWVGYVEHDEAKTVRPVAFAGAEDGFFTEVTISWGETPEGEGAVGRSIRTMRPVLVSDTATDPCWQPWREAAARHGYGSVVSLPLVDRHGVAVGVFCLYGAEPNAFDDREIALLEELAMDLAFGLDSLGSRAKRAVAEDQLRESYDRLETMMRDVVESMGRIVEARDPYTQGHERRVAELAKDIGLEMGLSPDDVAAVEMAAMLHDIGKLCVPAEILTKPGTLSFSEFELIKDHSRRGYEILKDIAFPWPIADIVLQHHERADGSGYPSGLKGDDILPASRILAVADVVEAMASHRPYRPLIGLAQAMEEVHERPEAYDQDVVTACERLYQRGAIDL